MDGLSFAPMLLGQQPVPWKSAALIEYRSIRPKNTADLCTEGPLTPQEVDEYVSAYGYGMNSELDEVGRPKLCSSPVLKSHLRSGTDRKQEHFHDGPNNTFAALRIIDGKDDLLYAEFVDVLNPLAWDFAKDQVNFREFYNVSEDYFMMNNLIKTAPKSLIDSLSKRLHDALACKGSDACLKVLGTAASPEVELLTV